MQVYRYPWNRFPPLIIHAEERVVKTHPCYHNAKSGDPQSAIELVREMLSQESMDHLSSLFSDFKPVLVSAHAVESRGVNAIPQAMAEYLSYQLQWPVETSIVQTNIVGHTGADGFTRLARQATFDGVVTPSANYVLVDDFIGQGGTLANLRGFLIRRGASIVGGTVLTGKAFSAMLSSDEQQIDQLREKHGAELESWWIDRFGFNYQCLTRSEARYLLNTPSAQRIRDQITQASEA
jgi:hypothetical protein